MHDFSSNFIVRNSVISPLGGIKLAGASIQGHGVLEPKRILNRYSLVYILQGEGRYRDETGADTSIGAGDVIQLHPNIEHWYGPLKGTRWNEIYIIFEGAIFDLWRNSSCFNLERKVVHLEPIEYWADRFAWACGVAPNRDSVDAVGEVVRLQQLLSEIYSASKQEASSDHNWLETAKLLLEANETPRAASKTLGMNYETFRKRFKKHAGVAPQQYRILRLIETAQEILKEEQVSVKDVANRLGYCDEFHFSKQFTKIVGCAPSAYRSVIGSRKSFSV